MSLFRRLGEKSWETPGLELPEPSTYRPEAARVGLIVYLVVVSFLFFIITSAYFMRMGIDTGHGTHGGGTDWHPMPEPPLVWINTIVLMLASIGWEVARAASRMQSAVGAKATHRAFVASGALGLLFLVGQMLLWREYAASGYLLQSTPANSFFYLITGLHGLHILGGLYVWARALVRAGRDPAARLPIELCAGYWHFLLLVWLAMLALLIST